VLKFTSSTGGQGLQRPKCSLLSCWENLVDLHVVLVDLRRSSSYSRVADKQSCLSTALNERERKYTNCGLPFSFAAWEIPRVVITLGRTKIPPGTETLSAQDTRAKGLYWRRKYLIRLGCRFYVMSRKTK